jgi:hypothetical protein
MTYVAVLHSKSIVNRIFAVSNLYSAALRSKRSALSCLIFDFQRGGFRVLQENGAEKGDSFMSYLNSVTIVGFVGADPEQRQAKGNGSKFTVLSVATQRCWKNAEDEWVSKVEWHRIVIIWNFCRVASN